MGDSTHIDGSLYGVFSAELWVYSPVINYLGTVNSVHINW